MQTPEAIQWSECLARERPGRRVLLAVVIVALAVAAGMAAQEWFVGALAAVGLAAVTAEGWAGCRCSMDAQGIARIGPFKRRQLPWTMVEAFTVANEGVTLARVSGRGAISFHLPGIAEVDRVRVLPGWRAWHAWWMASRAPMETSEHG